MPDTPFSSTRQFPVRENDSVTYTLQLALDNAGRPLFYFSNIFTPVCLTGECKPVYINFYWDLLGNYTRYNLPQHEVLTRADHRDFKPEDYGKLHEILSNASSMFADLQIEELIAPGTENLADSVDGKTGATIKTIKDEVIEGAVYTCFTLWHIAHGKVTDEMRRITESYRDQGLLHRFLADSNHHYQYWAMEKVMDRNGRIAPGFEADMLKVIRGKNIFTARSALQKTAPAFFAEEERQSWLWDTYRNAAYPLQVTILKKLDSIPLSQTLVERLSENITTQGQEQCKLRLSLLAAQKQLPPEAQQNLAMSMEQANEAYAASIYKVLKQFRPAGEAINSKILQYEKEHQKKQ